MVEDSGKKQSREFLLGFQMAGFPALILYSAYSAGWRVTDNKAVIYLCFLGWVLGAPIVIFLELIIGLAFALIRGTWAAWIGILLGLAVSLALLIFCGAWKV